MNVNNTAKLSIAFLSIKQNSQN